MFKYLGLLINYIEEKEKKVLLYQIFVFTIHGKT